MLWVWVTVRCRLRRLFSLQQRGMSCASRAVVPSGCTWKLADLHQSLAQLSVMRLLLMGQPLSPCRRRATGAGLATADIFSTCFPPFKFHSHNSSSSSPSERVILSKTSLIPVVFWQNVLSLCRCCCIIRFVEALQHLTRGIQENQWWFLQLFWAPLVQDAWRGALWLYGCGKWKQSASLRERRWCGSD